MDHLALCMLTCLLVLGCASTTVENRAESRVSPRILISQGKYHEALRMLPSTIKAIEAESKRTGTSYSVLSGSIGSHVLLTIAESGDQDWGKILDDPEIPYSYKTALLHDIAETRLGKGAAWSAAEGFVIIPSKENARSWNEVSRMLQKAVSESSFAPNSAKPGR